jgi:hypothetical protein
VKSWRSEFGRLFCMIDDKVVPTLCELSSPPSFRIDAGLLLAALLSLVGYQVFLHMSSALEGVAKASRRSLMAQ